MEEPVAESPDSTTCDVEGFELAGYRLPASTTLLRSRQSHRVGTLALTAGTTEAAAPTTTTIITATASVTRSVVDRPNISDCRTADPMSAAGTPTTTPPNTRTSMCRRINARIDRGAAYSSGNSGSRGSLAAERGGCVTTLMRLPRLINRRWAIYFHLRLGDQGAHMVPPPNLFEPTSSGIPT